MHINSWVVGTKLQCARAKLNPPGHVSLLHTGVAFTPDCCACKDFQQIPTDCGENYACLWACAFGDMLQKVTLNFLTQCYLLSDQLACRSKTHPASGVNTRIGDQFGSSHSGAVGIKPVHPLFMVIFWRLYWSCCTALQT
eukprot:3539581-Amphidinium_carterae.1